MFGTALDKIPSSERPNNQMHRTATSRCGFEGIGLIGYWIRSQSPVPVAVGDLSFGVMSV